MKEVMAEEASPKVTIDLPSGPEPPVSKSATHPKEAVVVSSSLEPESLIPEFIVRLIHVGTALSEVLLRGDLSSEPKFLIPELEIQQIPTSVESSPHVSFHGEQNCSRIPLDGS